MSISYSELFEQLLAHSCPYGPDVNDPERPEYREFVFDLHCSTALVRCTFLSYDKDTERYSYEIHSVTIGCESMMDGCVECKTVTFDNIQRG